MAGKKRSRSHRLFHVPFVVTVSQLTQFSARFRSPLHLKYNLISSQGDIIISKYGMHGRLFISFLQESMAC